MAEQIGIYLYDCLADGEWCWYFIVLMLMAVLMSFHSPDILYLHLLPIEKSDYQVVHHRDGLDTRSLLASKATFWAHYTEFLSVYLFLSPWVTTILALLRIHFNFAEYLCILEKYIYLKIYIRLIQRHYFSNYYWLSIMTILEGRLNKISLFSIYHKLNDQK